ncbi:MAG: glycosyltransferase family 2 protein, partial [Phormidesmis sp.]
MPDFAEPAASELDTDLVFNAELFRGYAGRRLKAAIALASLWLVTIFLHSVSWGRELVLIVTGLMSTHALRVVFAKPLSRPKALLSANAMTAQASVASDWADWPYVSLLVAAKNEEQVIGQLAESLLQIDYPACRY